MEQFMTAEGHQIFVSYPEENNGLAVFSGQVRCTEVFGEDYEDDVPSAEV